VKQLAAEFTTVNEVFVDSPGATVPSLGLNEETPA
jgi:hypothetical protein